jgi:hypothetical protein
MSPSSAAQEGLWPLRGPSYSLSPSLSPIVGMNRHVLIKYLRTSYLRTHSRRAAEPPSGRARLRPERRPFRVPPPGPWELLESAMPYAMGAPGTKHQAAPR